MVLEDANVFAYLWGLIMTGSGGMIAFLTKRTVRRLDHADEEITKMKEDVAKHKIYSANTYAKDTTVQQSLARLHERIDQTAQENARQIAALSGDVKQILLILGSKK